ncbi:MAG: hypothetical protein ACPL1D_00370 [Microgenomates group bacterium]
MRKNLFLIILGIILFLAIGGTILFFGEKYSQPRKKTKNYYPSSKIELATAQELNKTFQHS